MPGLHSRAPAPTLPAPDREDETALVAQARLDGWGEYGSADGEFVWAMDAAVDAAGRVFVTDFANDRVQVFDADGRFLAAWGESGIEPGQFDSALGVAVGGDGIVYVTDGGRRLQAFRVGDLPVAAPSE